MTRIVWPVLCIWCFLLNFAYAEVGKTFLEQTAPPDEEIGYLQRALDIDPYNFGIYYGLGIAYYREKKYDKVIECHQKFTNLTDYPQAYQNLERAYRKIGDYSKAKEYGQKASGYKNSGFKNRARDSREVEALGKILQVNPSVGALYANLGSMDTVKKEDLDREIGYLQRALDIDPDNFGIYYGLGIAYYKNEEYDKALDYCIKFTQANPDCSLTYYGLGIAYNNRGDSTDALAQVEQLRRLGQFGLAGKLNAAIEGTSYQGSAENQAIDLKETIRRARELEERSPGGESNE